MPDSPEVSIIYGLAANAGKDSSILLDLRSDQGRGALNELISWANVITINAPGSALSSLGLRVVDLALLAESGSL